MSNSETNVKITVIVDNQAEQPLISEHGFSLWIETKDRTILFDTGNQHAFLSNGAQLKLDYSTVTDLIISHGHYDHTGGIHDVLERAPKTQIYMHQGAIQPRYSQKNRKAEPVRMPAISWKELDHVSDMAFHWATKPLNLSSTIGITGPIPRKTEYENTGGSFFFDEDCQIPDLIMDDIAMWIQTNEGLAVVVGCCHAGIVNTLEAIMSITGEKRIHTVIGGLHLLNATQDRLQKTVAALNEMKIGTLIPCHCTGDESVEYLRSHLRCTVQQGYAGLSLTF